MQSSRDMKKSAMHSQWDVEKHRKEAFRQLKEREKAEAQVSDLTTMLCTAGGG